MEVKMEVKMGVKKDNTFAGGSIAMQSASVAGYVGSGRTIVHFNSLREAHNSTFNSNFNSQKENSLL